MGTGGDGSGIGLGIGAYLLVGTYAIMTRTTESSRLYKAARDFKRPSNTLSSSCTPCDELSVADASSCTPCDELSVDDVLVDDILSRLRSTRAARAARELLEPIALQVLSFLHM